MDEQTKQKRKDIVGWVIYIAVLLAIIITFRCFLMIGRVPSESMEPTLMVHDWLIGDRHAYEEEKPQRGDIVIFYQKDENETMVKRVIGLPGETVSFVGGKYTSMGNRWMNRLIWMTLSKRIVEKKIKPLPFRRALISCWGITGKFPWMRDIGNIPTLQRMT